MRAAFIPNKIKGRSEFSVLVSESHADFLKIEKHRDA